MNWIKTLFESKRKRENDARIERVTRDIRLHGPHQVLQSVMKDIHECIEQSKSVAEQAATLPALDDLAHIAACLVSESLLGDEGKESIADRPWALLGNYYRTVAAGYLDVLSISHENSSQKRRPLDPLLFAGRAVRALGGWMHLRYLRYREPGKREWLQLGELYESAATKGYARAPLALYSSEEQTTIEREVLQILVMAVAPISNLLPSQVQALVALLRSCSSELRISTMFHEHTATFAFEPLSGEKPQRWSNTLPTLPGMRFFGVGTAYEALLLERQRAFAHARDRQVDALPPSHRERYLALLDRLLAAWSVQPPIRRHQRTAIASQVLVTHDWTYIRRLVRFTELAHAGRSNVYDSTNVYGVDISPRTPLDRSFEYSQKPVPVRQKDPLSNLLSFEDSLDGRHLESWYLVDASETGIGISNASPRGWEKVGMLIAFRDGANAEWKLGIVRRVHCSETGNIVLGIALVAESVYSSRLRVAVPKSAWGNRVNTCEPREFEYECILAVASNNTLLLQERALHREWNYKLITRGGIEAIRIGQAVERGINYDRFEVTTIKSACAA